MSGVGANCEGVIEVKIKTYDEMAFVIPESMNIRFEDDVNTLSYLQFLTKWEEFKRNPDDLKLYTDEI